MCARGWVDGCGLVLGVHTCIHRGVHVGAFVVLLTCLLSPFLPFPFLSLLSLSPSPSPFLPLCRSLLLLFHLSVPLSLLSSHTNLHILRLSPSSLPHPLSLARSLSLSLFISLSPSPISSLLSLPTVLQMMLRYQLDGVYLFETVLDISLSFVSVCIQSVHCIIWPPLNETAMHLNTNTEQTWRHLGKTSPHVAPPGEDITTLGDGNVFYPQSIFASTPSDGYTAILRSYGPVTLKSKGFRTFL